MEKYRFLKLFGAVLLLASMLLPLSSCTTDTGRDYTIVMEVISTLEFGEITWWFMVAAYFWPIVFFGILTLLIFLQTKRSGWSGNLPFPAAQATSGLPQKRTLPDVLPMSLVKTQTFWWRLVGSMALSNVQ